MNTQVNDSPLSGARQLRAMFPGVKILSLDHPDLPECAGRHLKDHNSSCFRGKCPEFGPHRSHMNDELAPLLGNPHEPRNYGWIPGSVDLALIDQDKATLEDAGITVPHTMEIRRDNAPEGRLHRVFRIPAGVTLTNGRGTLPAGIDVRVPTYVVGPGSKHATGATYAWNGVEPAPMPDALLKALTPHTEAAIGALDTDGEEFEPAGFRSALNREDGDRSCGTQGAVNTCYAAGVSLSHTVQLLRGTVAEDKYGPRLATEVQRCWRRCQSDGMPRVDPGLLARIEAHAHSPAVTNATMAPSASLLAELLGSADLAERPAARPLVRGWLNLNTTNQIFGPPKSLKSFVALDLACHVALGRRWQGLDTHQGNVLYVVAEGQDGIAKRVRGWELAWNHGNRIPRDRLAILPRAVQIVSDEWDVLLQVITYLKPALVIVDTQRRSTLNTKENDNDDQQRVFAALDRIKEATGACTIAVHHTNRSDDSHSSGGNAQDGAVDTGLRVVKKQSGGRTFVKVTAPFQKDEADDGCLDMEATAVHVGTDDRGKPVTTLIVAPVTPSAVSTLLVAESLTETQEPLVKALADCPAAGLTKAEVRASVRGTNEPSNIERMRFNRAWDALIKNKVIVETGKGSRFRLRSQDIDNG